MKIYFMLISVALMQSVGAQNVGIGVAAPLEKLDVAGNVKASDFKYSTAKTSYYTIPGAAFQPESSRDTFSLSLGFGSVSMFSVLNGKRLMAPVQLPHNAIMQTMTVYMADNSTTTDMQVLIYRKTITSNFFPDNIGFVGSTGSAGVTTLYSTPIATFASSNVIDNTIYTYYISVGSTGTWGGGIMSVLAVIITYSMNAPVN